MLAESFDHSNVYGSAVLGAQCGASVAINGDASLLAGDKRQALDFYEQAFELEPRIGEQPNLLEKLESLRLELGGA